MTVMTGLWATYDQYIYAAVAIFGTMAAVVMIHRITHHGASAEWFRSLHGVVPPFINIIGVLFGLTLAFLANDTWSAHDKTTNAVYREADALRSLQALSQKLSAGQRAAVDAALIEYRDAIVEEWPWLARRTVSPRASSAADALLSTLAMRDLGSNVGEGVQALMLRKASDLRDDRDTRITFSQAHVNPLKWLGMAFLGFVTLLSVAVVHAENARASTVAILLFALAAAPAAAIVLVQANPFQPPATVSSQPLKEALGGI